MHSGFCKNCGEIFESSQPNALFCCKPCSKKWHGLGEKRAASTSSVGAASELSVTADLLVLGHDVFSQESPCSRFDLCAYDRDTGALVKIEVKTARLRGDGEFLYPKPTNLDWDILALCVYDTRDVFYFDKKFEPIYDMARLPDAR